MDLKFINHHLEGIKKQFDYVKDEETFVITSMTVKFLIESLEQLTELYKDRESDIDFYWTTLINIGKIAKDCDNDIIYDIVRAIIEPNEFD